MDQLQREIEELASRAEALYAREIRAKVEPEHIGKYIVIEVESGDYEIDEDDMAAIARVQAKHPGRLFHIMRVGYKTMGRLGAANKNWVEMEARG